VADISNSAIQNIQQIVKFFKIEKMHNLIFDSEDAQAEEMSQAGVASGDNTTTVNLNSMDMDMSQGSDGLSEEGGGYNLNKVQGLLTDLKECIDLPLNFKPRTQEIDRNQKSHMSRNAKDEEYFLENNPVELVSILVKFLVELLMKLKIVESLETIPHSISRMLYLSNMKSNIPVEHELFNQYFFESNKMIVDELENMKG
jgi:hypothetical protein